MARRSYSLIGALIVFQAGAILLPSESMADELRRSSCWTYRNEERGSHRTLCFFDPPRVTMKNFNYISTDQSTFSTCNWTGSYSRHGVEISVKFRKGSGKCSNDADSPETAAECQFSGVDLACKGTAIVDGKAYDLDLVFK
jgi:hypothetical protein